jgi:nitrite reductase (cytochrome c-552)
MEALVGLIGDLKEAREQGKSDADLAVARGLQRHAQFRLDFIEAENSMGFHAPQEAARILAESIDLSRQAQIALRDPGFRPRDVQPGSDATRRIPASSSP